MPNMWNQRLHQDLQKLQKFVLVFIQQNCDIQLQTTHNHSIIASPSHRHNKNNTGVVPLKAKTVTLATKHACGVRHRGMVSICNESGEVGVILCDFR